MSFESDLTESMDKAEFILKRINSLRTQIQEEPTCGLNHKLETYISELKSVQIEISVRYNFLTIRNAIAKELAQPKL